jgi:hypothetical protein
MSLAECRVENAEWRVESAECRVLHYSILHTQPVRHSPDIQSGGCRTVIVIIIDWILLFLYIHVDYDLLITPPYYRGTGGCPFHPCSNYPVLRTRNQSGGCRTVIVIVIDRILLFLYIYVDYDLLITPPY